MTPSLSRRTTVASGDSTCAAPDSWFELLDSSRDRMTPLHELAEISRFGFTRPAPTASTACATSHSSASTLSPIHQEFQGRWGISRRDTRRIRIVRDGANVEHLVERRFLEPELHSLMEVKRAVVRKGDVGRMVINASMPRATDQAYPLRGLRHLRRATGLAHQGPPSPAAARTRPWYDLGLRPKPERADIFWPMAQQYRHVIPLNNDLLPSNHNLFDLWAREQNKVKLLWAVLNSTIAVLAKHQFGRAAGVEGNLKTEVVDVNMMLVPDIRKASPDAIERAVSACERMSRRNARRYLYEEFDLDDRRELDDATLEILGIEDPEERTALRDRLYRDVTDMQQAIRDREIIAQRDRRRSARRGTTTPQDIADELWAEHESSLRSASVPRGLPHSASNEGALFDLPSWRGRGGGGNDGHRCDLLKGRHDPCRRTGWRGASTWRSCSQARFLEALSQCHRAGQVRLPSDDVCDDAVSSFGQYRSKLQDQCTELARQRTTDQRRQRAVVDALLRKALQWRRP